MALIGQVISDNSLSFRNRVINGGFDVWQRGTSGSTAASFVADRWIINSNNTSHERSTDVPSGTGLRFSLLMTATSASNAQATTKIESLNCNGLVGKPITLSFWAKSTSGSTQLGTYISHCNSENDFGSTTTIGSGSFTLTSTWTRYSVTLTSSAPAGVLNGIQLGLFRNGTESSVTYIDGVQLEEGSVATPFETRHYGLELQLCQRYYWEKSADTGNTTQWNMHWYNSKSRIAVTTPVPMRTSITTTFTGSTGGAFFSTNDDSNYRNFTYVGASSEFSNGYPTLHLSFNDSGGSAATTGGGVAYIQNGRKITFSAEL